MKPENRINEFGRRLLLLGQTRICLGLKKTFLYKHHSGRKLSILFQKMKLSPINIRQRNLINEQS